MSARTRLLRGARGAEAPAGGRPILLATFGVPFDEEAVAVAIDAAVESGEPLVVANITTLEPLALSMIMGYDALEELTPDVSESARRPASIAAGFGVPVERLRIRTPRPVAALIDVVHEWDPGLVVFGPDPARVRRRPYRRAVAALRRDARCLVWFSSASVGLG